MQLPSSDPRSIHLDAVDCCVFWHAFTRHAQLTSAWGTVGGPLRLIRGIFLTSLSLSFVPTDDVAAMYRSVANAELKRLRAHPRSGLQCRHSKQQHVAALTSILQRLPLPTMH